MINKNFNPKPTRDMIIKTCGTFKYVKMPKGNTITALINNQNDLLERSFVSPDKVLSSLIPVR